MDQLIFICEPKNFPTPSNPEGFNIEGLSCKIKENEFSKILFDFSFLFYTKENIEGVDTFVVKDGVDSTIRRKTQIGVDTFIDIPSGLFSSTKATVYTTASVFSGAYGYTLLPIEDQTFLNEYFDSL